jgi:hypothetical protein
MTGLQRATTYLVVTGAVISFRLTLLAAPLGEHQNGVAGALSSGKQVRAGRSEAHECAALVHHEPASLDRQLHAGAVFGGARLVL